MDPKKKFHLFRTNKNFCVVPWTNFEVYTNGDIKTCSLGKKTLGNISDQPLDEILNGEPIKKIKENMLNNVPDKNCVKCQIRTIEEDNFKHLRNHYNSRLEQEDVNYEDINNFDMRFIDLHWSNICNLRCVMCNPGQSSLIAKDEKVFVAPIQQERIDEIIKVVTKNEDKIKEIYLSGGEPFYIPQNVKLLKALTNKEVPIRINTNMHWYKNNKLYEILKTFKNVQLTMSVDALYNKFNYIRTGANWETFIKNFKTVKEETQFEIRMNMIFSVINAIDVPKNIKYFYHDIGIKDITINLLENPKEIAPMNYPENKKQFIINELQSVLKTISIEHVNLLAQIKLCIANIKLPKKYNYEFRMSEITKRYDKPWREVHTDLI